MRILVFFDIHGLHNVYKALPDLAREHGAELIALVGDHLGCPGGYRSIEEVQRTDAREIIRTPQPHGIPSSTSWVTMNGPSTSARSTLSEMDFYKWVIEVFPQRMTRGGLSPPSQKRAHHGNRRSPSVRVLQGRETDRQVREDQRWLV